MRVHVPTLKIKSNDVVHTQTYLNKVLILYLTRRFILLIVISWLDMAMMNSFNLLSSYHEDYPTIAKLAGICMVLPASSVKCERGFSQQNLIKTKQRNQLESPHLDMLMRLKIEGPSISDFSFFKSSISLEEKSKEIIHLIYCRYPQLC